MKPFFNYVIQVVRLTFISLFRFELKPPTSYSLTIDLYLVIRLVFLFYPSLNQDLQLLIVQDQTIELPNPISFFFFLRKPISFIVD